VQSAEQPESEEEYEADRERRKYRNQRRKARERAGEIKELNITAMMDMMTIILVFLLKSYTSSSINVQQNESLQVPKSTTQQKPQESVNITISTREVTVNDKKTTQIVNGVVPAENMNGPLISPLLDALVKEVDKQKYIAKYNPAAPFTGRVNIIADKRVPYQTLIAVLYTAGQAELGQYKLLALKTE
jgi:biopolymer transport protein ExbD